MPKNYKDVEGSSNQEEAKGWQRDYGDYSKEGLQSMNVLKSAGKENSRSSECGHHGEP